jgi:signal transduction histidine kinase
MKAKQKTALAAPHPTMSDHLPVAPSHTKPPATSLRSHFFDLSLDLLCVLDAGGRIEDANTAFLTAVGREAHQIQQVAFVEFVDGDDHAEVAALLESPDTLVAPLSFGCRMRCFDATIRWYLWTLYPLSPGHLHAVGKNITPYKEMEAKEVERNVFAEALLDTVLAINSSLALNQVLERILSNVGKVVAYEYVGILLVVGDKAEVVGMQNGTKHSQKMKELAGIRFSIHADEHLRYMFQSHASCIIPELKRLPDWIDASVMKSGGAFLGSPVILDNEVIGFLCVFNSKKEFFTPLHAQQLITFANQAGIAINNARLYEQAQSAAVLRERQRMAQELHDAVTQDLFAASTFADLLPRAIVQKPHAITQYAAKISELIRRAVEQMRMILIELHPDTLTTTRLEILLQQLCDIFSRQTGIPVQFQSNTKIILEEQAQIAAYRIAQEALHNINKHAGATQVTVALHHTDQYLTLTIQDNGSGFNQDAIMEIQFGVRGMRERAETIHADLSIESKTGLGTKIRLRKKIL